MATTYSTYEAKAKFSEIIRKVRDGQPIRISYHGVTVAEIRPVYSTERTEQALADLEKDGVLARAEDDRGPLKPLAKKRGALRRFLESRD